LRRFISLRKRNTRTHPLFNRNITGTLKAAGFKPEAKKAGLTDGKSGWVGRRKYVQHEKVDARCSGIGRRIGPGNDAGESR
jgi:hypothetical protein